MALLRPKLENGVYVFCTTKRSIKVSALATFNEHEGTTYILSKYDADSLNLTYDGQWGWVSIGYQSELSMVGLTAIIAQILAAHDMPCNVVAAYYHDHIFVPIDRADEAVSLLIKIEI